KLNDLCFTNV
nr:Chain C, Spike protein S1 peptide [Severe acute respiratory syndrome coronavirus 2]7M8S_F Chain F, Spike protein S1 peptide [Severe acute respiratory syndrome coronavirus 2]